MRYYLDKADAQKVKKIQQSLKKADLELVKIEKANKKIKDPVVAKKTSEARKMLKKLGRWVIGLASGVISLAVFTFAYFGILRLILGINNRLDARGAGERFRGWRQRNNLNPDNGRPLGGNGGVGLGPLATEEDARIAREAEERSRARREAQHSASNAQNSLRQVERDVRELDVDWNRETRLERERRTRKEQSENSPRSFGPEFFENDPRREEDSGYKIRRSKRHRLTMHDSMPWSK